MSAMNAVIDATAVSFGIAYTVIMLAGIVYLAWHEPRGKVLRP
jgi:hypothetical protein